MFGKQRISSYCCKHVLLHIAKEGKHENFYCYIMILWVCNFPNIGNKVYRIKESFITSNLPKKCLHKKSQRHAHQISIHFYFHLSQLLDIKWTSESIDFNHKSTCDIGMIFQIIFRLILKLILYVLQQQLS